jgi:hypothetical protein
VPEYSERNPESDRKLKKNRPVPFGWNGAVFYPEFQLRPVLHAQSAGSPLCGSQEGKKRLFIQLQDGQECLRGHLHLVVAKSAAFRFCLTAKTSSAPLLLRFPPKPLALSFGGNPVMHASSFCLLKTLRVSKAD